MTKSNHSQLEEEIGRQLAKWDHLELADYDFRPWALEANPFLLRAGCMYEYARESRKIRGLAGVMNPKRVAQDWESFVPARLPGERDDVTLAEVSLSRHEEFMGLNAHDAERVLGGWLFVFADLAGPLIANTSFAKLLREHSDTLTKVFGNLDRLPRVSERARYFFPVEPIEFAFNAELGGGRTFEEWAKGNARETNGDGSEILALRIHWSVATNKELGEAMTRFAAAKRPKTHPEPRRQGGRGNRGNVSGALEAMLRANSPKRNPERLRRSVFAGATVILFRVAWRNATDSEIGRAMERFALANRPGRYPCPGRVGRGKGSSVDAALNALSAMRLARWSPKKLREVEATERGSAETRRDAITRFSAIRLRPATNETIDACNFDRLAADGRRFFKQLHPFKEPAANWRTFHAARRTEK